jgi:type IV secretory pathway VirB10-like protein
MRANSVLVALLLLLAFVAASQNLAKRSRPVATDPASASTDETTEEPYFENENVEAFKEDIGGKPKSVPVPQPPPVSAEGPKSTKSSRPKKHGPKSEKTKKPAKKSDSKPSRGKRSKKSSKPQKKSRKPACRGPKQQKDRSNSSQKKVQKGEHDGRGHRQNHARTSKSKSQFVNRRDKRSRA